MSAENEAPPRRVRARSGDRILRSVGSDFPGSVVVSPTGLAENDRGYSMRLET